MKLVPYASHDQVLHFTLEIRPRSDQSRFARCASRVRRTFVRDVQMSRRGVIYPSSSTRARETRRIALGDSRMCVARALSTASSTALLPRLCRSVQYDTIRWRTPLSRRVSGSLSGHTTHIAAASTRAPSTLIYTRLHSRPAYRGRQTMTGGACGH